jgi:hypothetical protein
MMVFWTAGFVLLTLLINAPLLPLVLRLTGLSKVRSKRLHLAYAVVLPVTKPVCGLCK